MGHEQLPHSFSKITTIFVKVEWTWLLNRKDKRYCRSILVILHAHYKMCFMAYGSLNASFSIYSHCLHHIYGLQIFHGSSVTGPATVQCLKSVIITCFSILGKEVNIKMLNPYQECSARTKRGNTLEYCSIINEYSSCTGTNE